MNYVLIGGAALVGFIAFYQLFLRKLDAHRLARYMRWGAGGAVVLLTLLLLMRGQAGIASVTGYVAYLILRYGRIGGFSFEDPNPSVDNESAVRARFISMTLDHDTGEVTGKVIAGRFRGRELMSLNEDETRLLLDDVARDPDSLALLETWLDKNREGWREHFDGQSGASAGASEAPAADPDAEAYDILGLKPGATKDEIRAAYRKLMMGVHPDQGGSAYLAAKINSAKDRLLKKARAR
jgi:hypothetical protein